MREMWKPPEKKVIDPEKVRKVQEALEKMVWDGEISLSHVAEISPELRALLQPEYLASAFGEELSEAKETPFEVWVQRRLDQGATVKASPAKYMGIPTINVREEWPGDPYRTIYNSRVYKYSQS